MMRSKAILVLLFVAAVAQLAWLYPQMPARLATHYDGAGSPNGWMTREGAIVFHLAILGVTALAFVALPVLLGRLSPTLINIPNREYWLAPERRAATVAALQNWMAFLGCGAVALMIAITQLNFQANLRSEPKLSSTALVACVGAFLLYMGGWIFALHRKFPKPQRT
jgi:uncharacterized membrane protein